MKTTLKLKQVSFIVAEKPLFTATIAVFFSAVIMMAALTIFQDYLLLTNVARCAFWALVVLGVVHFAITKTFITRFSENKHRIPLLYYGGRARIYKRPILKKVPFVEIVFPHDWDVAHTMGEHRVPLFIKMDTASRETFILYFNLKVETFGDFRAQDLEKLIALQKAKFPNQKKFEFIDCLEDFLVADCLRNHNSIKFLLDEYHLRQINLKLLEQGVLQMVKIPSLFTNVKNMELRLSEVQRIITLNPSIRTPLFNKAAAVL